MFFVFWGKKTTVTQLGYVADYCRICRGIHTFRMDRIGVASHLYGIALDSGEYLGTTQTCLSCNIPIGATLDRFRSILKNYPSEIGELIRETHPGACEEFADQLAIDEQIESDPHRMPTELRNTLIREVFQMAGAHFEKEREESGNRILLIALPPLDPSAAEISDALNQLDWKRISKGYPLDAEKVLRRLRKQEQPQEYDY